MVAVYNMNKVDIRDLLASTDTDDILTEEAFPCTARVEVFSAFFCQPYHGPRGISEPCMKMVGRVSSLCIEEDDDRMFSCGTKEILLMEPEDVIVEYRLSPEEIASLAAKGLFHDPDFGVPANLVGNIIEIPITINYKAIYETPVCAVEIIAPNEIQTSTEANKYYGLFENCPVSEVVAQMQNGTYEYSRMNEFRPALIDQFQPPVVERQEEDVREDGLGVEDHEDAAIIQQVADTIAAEDARAAAAREEMDGSQANEILHKAQEEAQRDQQAQSETQAPESQLYREDGVPEGERDKTKSPSHLYDRLMQHAKEATQRQARPDEERSYEEANREEQAAEEEKKDSLPVDESVVDEDGSNPKDKAKADAKKAQETVRRIDVAMDNQALNEGRDDISGFGAGDGKKSMAQQLIDKARERAKQASEQAPEAPQSPAQPEGEQPSFL